MVQPLELGTAAASTSSSPDELSDTTHFLDFLEPFSSVAISFFFAPDPAPNATNENNYPQKRPEFQQGVARGGEARRRLDAGDTQENRKLQKKC